MVAAHPRSGSPLRERWPIHRPTAHQPNGKSPIEVRLMNAAVIITYVDFIAFTCTSQITELELAKLYAFDLLVLSKGGTCQAQLKLVHNAIILIHTGEAHPQSCDSSKERQLIHRVGASPHSGGSSTWRHLIQRAAAH